MVVEAAEAAGGRVPFAFPINSRLTLCVVQSGF